MLWFAFFCFLEVLRIKSCISEEHFEVPFHWKSCHSFSIFYVFILKIYLNTKIIEEIYFTYDEKNERIIM